MPDLTRAIQALTYDEIEQRFDDGTTRQGIGVPLLQRSIANDLRQLEAVLGAKGKTPTCSPSRRQSMKRCWRSEA